MANLDLTAPRNAPPGDAFTFACPICRADLTPVGRGGLSALAARPLPPSLPRRPVAHEDVAEDKSSSYVEEVELRCPADGAVFHQTGGIWRFLPPGRLAHYAQFIREYETVRRAEGRISPDDAYYRSLPFRDLTGRQNDNWRIRAKSFRVLLDRAVRPLEVRLAHPLTVVDLGAGNGWLSYQLAKRGHCVVAVDLLVNDFDGLGCHVHYDAPFTPVQAEFEHLPFPDGQADLVVFNASIHYSTDYAVTLAEALRVLRPDGILAIVDSPVYHDASSGARMVREREDQFARQYGFASNSIPSENFLTYSRLEELADLLHLKWQRIQPFYGLGWALRPWRARLRRHREPARFMVLLCAKEGKDGRETRQHSLLPIHPIHRKVRRLLTKIRYKLFARGRYDTLVMEEVAGRPILVLPGVFNPKLLRTGEILVRALDSHLLPMGSRVLDMGTGSGIGAVFAAGWAAEVVAIDVNPDAVRCARINALLNRVESRVQVLEGDLFAPIGDRRFDVVLFNPPYYRGVPRNRLDVAWRSTDLIERFAAELPAHLTPGGHALVVLSTDGEQSAFLEAFHAAGMNITVVTATDLGNEVVTVYRLFVPTPEGSTLQPASSLESSLQLGSAPGVEASAGYPTETTRAAKASLAQALLPGVSGGFDDE